MELIPVKREDKNSELNRKEKRLLRGAAGQLNWVASQTRPDIAFDACVACVSLKNTTLRDIHMVNKSIRKLKAVNVALHFNDNGNIEEASILYYCDFVISQHQRRKLSKLTHSFSTGKQW